MSDTPKITPAQRSLGDMDVEIGGVMVSVDPERDTPERLRGYLAAFDPGIRGLTGAE